MTDEVTSRDIFVKWCLGRHYNFSVGTTAGLQLDDQECNAHSCAFHCCWRLVERHHSVYFYCRTKQQQRAGGG